MDAYILLIETKAGNTEGVRFPSQEAAYEWEEKSGVQGVGTIRIITKSEAKREAL